MVSSTFQLPLRFRLQNSSTGARLRDEIGRLTVGQFFSDHWKAYAEVFPPDKLKQTKAETYTVKGYNCRISHYLARFKRKGLCYSRSEDSLNPLFLKLNNRLSIEI